MLANMPKITPASYAYIVEGIEKQLAAKVKALQDKSIGVDEINTLIRSFLSQKEMNVQDEDEIKVLAGQLYLLLCKYNL